MVGRGFPSADGELGLTRIAAAPAVFRCVSSLLLLLWHFLLLGLSWASMFILHRFCLLILACVLRISSHIETFVPTTCSHCR